MKVIGPFDTDYKKHECFWGKQPSKLLEGTLSIFPLNKKLKALDLGAGEGRNSIFLAKQGFEVSAMDISPIAVNRIKETAKSENVIINCVLGDLARFNSEIKYDLVVLYGVLHLIPSPTREQILEKAKICVKIGGAIVISAFLDSVPLPKCQDHLTVNFYKKGELLNSFSGWQIISYNEEVKPDCHPGYPKHQHAHAKLLAIKV